MPASSRRATSRRKPPAFIPNKLIVRFKADALHGAIPAASRGVRSVRAALPEQVSGPLQLLTRECGLRRIDPLLIPSGRDPYLARLSRSA